MNIFLKPRVAVGLLAGTIGTVGGLCVAMGLFDPPLLPFEGEFESQVLDLEKWQVDNDGTCVFERVEQPVRSGAHSLRIVSQAGGRCEVLPWVGKTILGRQLLEPFREDRWYAFSVYLPHDWEANQANEVIGQWHSSKDVFFGEDSGRGPPLAIRIVGKNWRITAGSDSDLLSEPGFKSGHIIARRSIETGQWTDWVVHARWSWEQDGLTEIWMNGIPVISRTGPNTYFDLRGVYLKLGSYHPGLSRTLFLDRVRVQSADLDPEEFAR